MLYSIKVEPRPYPPQPILYLRQSQSFLCAWYPDHGRLLSVLQPSTKGVHNIVESPALVNSVKELGSCTKSVGSDFAGGQSPPCHAARGRGKRSRTGCARRAPAEAPGTTTSSRWA